MFEFQLKISCCGKGPGNLEQAGGKRDMYILITYIIHAIDTYHYSFVVHGNNHKEYNVF